MSSLHKGLPADMWAGAAASEEGNNVKPICISISQKAICCVVTVSCVKTECCFEWIQVSLTNTGVCVDILRLFSCFLLLFPLRLRGGFQLDSITTVPTSLLLGHMPTEREREREREQQLGTKKEDGDNLWQTLRLWNVVGTDTGLASYILSMSKYS